MATIKVIGDAVVIASALKTEELETIQKYNPDALTLKGGEDGKEPIFMVKTGIGSINKYGISFSGTDRVSKNAILTMVTNLPADEDIKEVIADKYGSALMKLNELEESLPAVIEEIKANKAAVISSIETVSLAPNDPCCEAAE